VLFSFGGVARLPRPCGTFEDEFVARGDEFFGREDAAGEEGGGFECGCDPFSGVFEVGEEGWHGVRTS